MSTTTATLSKSKSRTSPRKAFVNREKPNRFTFDGLSWDQYEKLYEAFEGTHAFVTYDNGLVEIMTTGRKHEHEKAILARLLWALSEELDIPIECFGSATWKQEKLNKGIEADDCYYIRNLSRIKGDEIDLDRDPPPDLAIEVEISTRIGVRRKIYAALGIPELWRFDGKRLIFMHLSKRKEYEVRDSSWNLPFLKSADLEPFIHMQQKATQHEV